MYKISSFGTIISLRYNKTLKPSEHKDGYFMVVLSKDKTQKMKYIHRLVAENFISNPNKLLEVNHKDGNKQNNDVTNLEWCTRLENIRHIYKNGLKKTGKYLYNARAVNQYNLNNKFIAKYDTQTEASKKTKVKQCDISRCCRGLRNNAGGYIWKYSDLELLEGDK